MYLPYTQFDGFKDVLGQENVREIMLEDNEHFHQSRVKIAQLKIRSHCRQRREVLLETWFHLLAMLRYPPDPLPLQDIVANKNQNIRVILRKKVKIQAEC